MKFQNFFEKLVNPIKKISLINTVYYVKLFKNNNHCYITCCNPDWVTYKKENNFTVFAPVMLSPHTLSYNCVPRMGDALHTKIMNEAETYFHIYHPIDIFLNSSTTLELFSFAWTDNDNVRSMNWYLNNLKLLNQFVFHLKNKLNCLIEDQIEAFKIQQSYQSIYHEPQSHTPLSSPIIPVNIVLNKKEITLTSREISIINYFLKGYSSKRIAQSVFLSHRTVEWYLERIRQKLECPTKNSLIDLLENKFKSELSKYNLTDDF